jgi:hypothetical protein
MGDKYALHDLVQLDASTAGVIIAVERGAARVLTNQGSATAPDVRVCKVRGGGAGARHGGSRRQREASQRLSGSVPRALLSHLNNHAHPTPTPPPPPHRSQTSPAKSQTRARRPSTARAPPSASARRWRSWTASSRARRVRRSERGLGCGGVGGEGRRDVWRAKRGRQAAQSCRAVTPPPPLPTPTPPHPPKRHRPRHRARPRVPEARRRARQVARRLCLRQEPQLLDQGRRRRGRRGRRRRPAAAAARARLLWPRRPWRARRVWRPRARARRRRRAGGHGGQGAGRRVLRLQGPRAHGARARGGAFAGGLYGGRRGRLSQRCSLASRRPRARPPAAPHGAKGRRLSRAPARSAPPCLSVRPNTARKPPPTCGWSLTPSTASSRWSGNTCSRWVGGGEAGGEQAGSVQGLWCRGRRVLRVAPGPGQGPSAFAAAAASLRSARPCALHRPRAPRWPAAWGAASRRASAAASRRPAASAWGAASRRRSRRRRARCRARRRTRR